MTLSPTEQARADLLASLELSTVRDLDDPNVAETLAIKVIARLDEEAYRHLIHIVDRAKAIAVARSKGEAS
ncbi:hypothetical protein ACH5AO_11270 [Streptomyces sp. NPDC018964]|uniref:hypothetical protein n=1 Tax=Streptomyces sp. NPDC018964 TaxID=3365058 RepID=UPI0037B96E32